MATNAEVKDLLEAGVHFGHLTRKWNPNMAPYIYMERNGIHVINLYKTVAKLDEACEALKKIYAFGDEYKKFLDSCKTERESVKYIITSAEKAGFTDLNKGKTKDGKYYYNYKGKLAVLIRTADKPLTEGMKIIASHIDSPRLDLKQNPLYEDNNIAFLKTHYYGGIKKYQWMTRPLAINGVFALKDGSVK